MRLPKNRSSCSFTSVPQFVALHLLLQEAKKDIVRPMQTLEKKIHHWVGSGLIDSATGNRIIEFEKQSAGKLRWPAILAVAFGTLMLAAGVLLFVAAHWDQMSPARRFVSVLAMVAVFHLAAGLLQHKIPMLGVALHTAGTVSLGAGIFLAGQIFNLQEHWPGGLMLWALGAVLGWFFLREWPQALLAALLVPAWITGEWLVATERFPDGGNVAAQGLLLLAVLFISIRRAEDSNRHFRTALIWCGCLAVVPLTFLMAESSYADSYWHPQNHLPVPFAVIGYTCAYVPSLVIAWIARKSEAIWIVVFACWIGILGLLSRGYFPIDYAFIYLWRAAGAVLLCWWGVRDNRKLFINLGSACFALTVFAFYFSNVLDKFGRATGLITLGLLFLLSGWVLNRLRSDLIARAAAGGH